MWKRLITTLLTAALLLPTLAAAAPSLPDIKGHWAEASIRKAVESGWVDGYPNGSFQPEKTITRAEFTKMLLDAIHLTPDCETVVWMKEEAIYYPQGSYLTKDYRPRLFDMKDHWLTKQGWLDAAMYSGMVVPKDYNDYIFRPEKPIARYEIALMADRALGLVYPANKEVTEPLPFTDSGEFSDWKAGYINEAVKAGIISGYPDGTFGAAKTATRAEAVVIVQRVVEQMEKGVNPDLKAVGQYIRWPLDGGRTGVLLEKELDDVTFQEVDGVIYASVRDLYRALEEMMRSYGDVSEYHSVGNCWLPIEQAIGFAYGNGVYNYQAGNQYYAWANTASMSSGADTPSEYDEQFTVPARLLYGEVMIPVYDFSRGDPEGFDPWAGSWNEQTKTLTIPFVDKDVFVNLA